MAEGPGRIARRKALGASSALRLPAPASLLSGRGPDTGLRGRRHFCLAARFERVSFSDFRSAEDK
jgi:hypothetical protein